MKKVTSRTIGTIISLIAMVITIYYQVNDDYGNAFTYLLIAFVFRSDWGILNFWVRKDK